MNTTNVCSLLINSGYRGCATPDGCATVWSSNALNRIATTENERLVNKLREEYLLERREQGREMYIREWAGTEGDIYRAENRGDGDIIMLPEVSPFRESNRNALHINWTSNAFALKRGIIGNANRKAKERIATKGEREKKREVKRYASDSINWINGSFERVSTLNQNSYTLILYTLRLFPDIFHLMTLKWIMTVTVDQNWPSFVLKFLFEYLKRSFKRYA